MASQGTPRRRSSDEVTTAVERAVKDAHVETRLAEHEQHLKQINGSQLEMVSEQKQMNVTLSDLALKLNTLTVRMAVLTGIGGLVGGVLVGVTIFLITGQISLVSHGR